MKQWTVTYREKSGLKTSVVIEAEDRAGVFAELKQRGINAISIAEGVVKAKRNATGGVSKAVWGVVAAVVAVALIGVVRMMMPKEVATVGDVSKTELIKKTPTPKNTEVQSTIVPEANNVQVAQTKEPVVHSARKMVTNGWVRLPNGKMHYRKGLLSTEGQTRPKSRYCIFKHYTDNEFAALLTIKPGDFMVGGAVFPRDYEKRFLESLKTDIEIAEDDPEDIKEVKRAVIQVRQEMKAALDKGEDIRIIVREAYDQAQRLATYKRTVKDELARLREIPNLKESDIEDFETAANRMLEKEGIAPIKIGPLMRAKLLNMNRQGEQK